MNINKLVCVAFDSRGVIMRQNHAGMSLASLRGPCSCHYKVRPHCVPNVQPQATQLFLGLPLMAYFLTSMAVVLAPGREPGNKHCSVVVVVVVVLLLLSHFTLFLLGAYQLKIGPLKRQALPKKCKQPTVIVSPWRKRGLTVTNARRAMSKLSSMLRTAALLLSRQQDVRIR